MYVIDEVALSALFPKLCVAYMLFLFINDSNIFCVLSGLDLINSNTKLMT